MSGNSGRKGHPVKGGNIAGQWKAIYAKGYVTKGKDGKGKYNPRHNHNNNAAKNTPSGRTVIGGGAAGLRGSGLGGKVDHSATRAARIDAGRMAAAAGVARAATKHNADYRAYHQSRSGLALSASQSAHSRAKGFQATKAAARGVQATMQANRKAARQERINAARQQDNPKARKFLAMKERLGRDGALKAMRNRSERIAAGKAKYADFAAKRDAAHGGGLFGSQRSSQKADHSATRAARIAEGKKVAHEQLDRLRTVTSGSRRQSVTNLRNYRQNPTFTAHLLTDNKSDTLSPKRLKGIYSSVAVAARSTNARSVLKRNWPKRK